MPNATVLQPLRRYALHAILLVAISVLTPGAFAQEAGESRSKAAAQPPKQATPKLSLQARTPGGEATLEADQQRQSGNMFYADGHVDVHYENARLRADHVEYDSETQVVSGARQRAARLLDAARGSGRRALRIAHRARHVSSCARRRLRCSAGRCRRC